MTKESAPNVTGLYQLYDLTAETCGGPIMAERKPGPAIRAFHDVLSNRDTLPGKYPDHFTLIKVGDQDLSSGRIISTEVEVIATGAAWRSQQDRDRQLQDGPTGTDLMRAMQEHAR